MNEADLRELIGGVAGIEQTILTELLNHIVILEKRPKPPESCKGCKWEDKNKSQLTNKYVLCPFCTRYYQDRFDAGE